MKTIRRRSASWCLLLGVTLLAPLVVGCGPALGAGLGVWLGLKAVEEDNHPPAIVLGTIERWAGPVEIPVTVFDSEGDTVRFKLEYDLGSGYQVGTLDPGSVQGSSGGTEATLVWLDPPGAPGYGYVGEIGLRITPRDDDNTGSSVTTTITFGNDAPVVSVEPVEGTYTTSVPVFFTLTDSSSDPLELVIEFKLAPGTTGTDNEPLDEWTEATFVPSVAVWPSAPASEGGLDQLVLWNSGDDLDGLDYRGVAEVRVFARDHATANSEVLVSNVATTGEFMILHNTPPEVVFLDNPLPPGSLPQDAYGFNVPFWVEISDEQSDDSVLQVEYRIDPNGPWRPTSVGGLFETSPEGKEHELEWNARADLTEIDLPRYIGDVELRMRAFDTEFGEYDTLSEPIALNLAMIRKTVNLSQRDGYDATRYEGVEQDSAYLGYAVAGLGDVNRNGFPDFALGAPQHNDRGAVFVQFGGEHLPGEATRELESWDPQLEPEQGVLILGEQDKQRFGQTVAALGDVNGDGFRDFAIGSPRYGASNRGAVYIAFGRQDLQGADPQISADELSLKIVGASNNARLGYSISGVGDVNGNGYDDILIGEPWYHDGFTFELGRAYLIYGHENLHTATIDLNSLGSQGVVITGEEGHHLGYSVAGAGDVNGNGFNDILIGAPNHGSVSQNGYVHLIYGDDSLPGAITPSGYLDGNNGLTYLPANDHIIGERVGGAGDVTGTGYSDFLIGTRRVVALEPEPLFMGSNVAYLVYGDGIGTSPSQSLSSPDGTTFTTLRRDFGVVGSMATLPVVRGLGDINGNGRADFGLGFPLAASGAGAAHVVYGRDDFGSLFNLSDTEVDEAAMIVGINAEQLGASLSALGDVSGSGVHDILIGAPLAHGDDHGAAYVVFGGPFVAQPAAEVTLIDPSGERELRAAGEVPDRSTISNPFTHLYLEWANGNASTTTVTMARNHDALTVLPTGVNAEDLLPHIHIDTNRAGQAEVRYLYHDGLFPDREPTQFHIYRGQSPSGPWFPVDTIPFNDQSWRLEFPLDTVAHGGEQYFIIEIETD